MTLVCEPYLSAVGRLVDALQVLVLELETVRRQGASGSSAEVAALDTAAVHTMNAIGDLVAALKATAQTQRADVPTSACGPKVRYVTSDAR